jgi:hypothetical protein
MLSDPPVDVRRERGQFRRLSTNFGGIGRGPVNIDANITPIAFLTFQVRG